MKGNGRIAFVAGEVRASKGSLKKYDEQEPGDKRSQQEKSDGWGGVFTSCNYAHCVRSNKDMSIWKKRERLKAS